MATRIIIVGQSTDLDSLVVHAHILQCLLCRHVLQEMWRSGVVLEAGFRRRTPIQEGKSGWMRSMYVLAKA